MGLREESCIGEIVTAVDRGAEESRRGETPGNSLRPGSPNAGPSATVARATSVQDDNASGWMTTRMNG